MTEPLERKELEWEKYTGDSHVHWFCGGWSIFSTADEPGLFRLYTRPVGATALVEGLESLDAAKSLAQRLQNVLDGTEERPESDLISRQAAIEEMKQQFDVTYFNTWDDFIPVLENLPGWAEPPSAPLEPRVTKEWLEQIAHSVMSDPERWERMGWFPHEPRVGHVEDKIWLGLLMFIEAVMAALSAPPLAVVSEE